MRICPHRIGEQVDFTTTDDPNIIWPQTTWTAVEGSFPLASSSSHLLGSTGGSESKSYTPAGTVGGHVLTVNEMPSHGHEAKLYASNNASGEDGGTSGILAWANNDRGYPAAAVGSAYYHQWYAPSIRNSGGGASHNHGFTGTASTLDVMPPYTTVNRWKRVA